MEVLKTKGDTHTDLTGFHSIERTYTDQTITDDFRIVRKIDSQEDAEGSCYDWYEIDHHYRVADKTGPLVEQTKVVEKTASIAFVRMAETGVIDDATAGEHTDLFAEWATSVAYKQGDIRSYNGLLYRCVQAHSSQENWEPPNAASLWTKIADPTEEWPAWSQPIGAHDAYDNGDKVFHGDKHWVSMTNGNVWEPGVYGWEEATE